MDASPKMSLAERMKILEDKEEQWKCKGKGAANDSVQFTVAGRMAKRGDTARVAAAESFLPRDGSQAPCFHETRRGEAPPLTRTSGWRPKQPPMHFYALPSFPRSRVRNGEERVPSYSREEVQRRARKAAGR